jgi:hypothetical protein
MITCQFLGKLADLNAEVLIDCGDDRCALILEGYRPCMLIAAGLQPELRNCERNGTGRAELLAQFRHAEPFQRGGV